MFLWLFYHIVMHQVVLWSHVALNHPIYTD